MTIRSLHIAAALGGWLLCADALARTDYTPAQYLQNYALSSCLAQVFANSPAGQDAAAAAGGYLQLGSHAAEAYTAVRQLAAEYAARTYHSKQGSQIALHTMKCIDLFHSPALQALIGQAEAERCRHADEEPECKP